MKKEETKPRNKRNTSKRLKLISKNEEILNGKGKTSIVVANAKAQTRKKYLKKVSLSSS
jgi:hypothetical protein